MAPDPPNTMPEAAPAAADDPEDLSLVPASPFRNAGERQPNFERAGTDFTDDGSGLPHYGHTGVLFQTS